MPNGMPIEIALGFVALLGFFLWDALRHRDEPWFKFLMPAGYTVLAIGIIYFFIPALILGAVTMGCGLAATNIWRWKKR